MTKSLHILLFLAVFLPLTGFSKEETMEERKQRIVRKYLREQATLTQSDILVPSDLPEDDAVKNSEKFKQPEINLKREESPAVPVLPPPRPRPVETKENANWLLEGLDTDADNPFAADDPYANNNENTPSDDYWSLWGGKPSRSESAAGSRNERKGYNPYAQEDRSGQYMDPRSRSSFMEDSSRQSGRYVAGETDIFGRPKREVKPSGAFGVNNPSRSYGASPDAGLLTTPSADTRSSEDRADRRKESGFQPYKNPFTTETDEQRLRGGATVPRNKQDTYRRPDAFQQWKERNKSFDPTKDDAYIDELMRQNR